VVRDADKALKFRIAEHKALGMLEVLDAGGYDVSGLRLKANVEKETAKQRRQDDIDMARRDGERSVKKQIIAVVPAVALGAVYLLGCVYVGGVAAGTKAAISTLGPVARFFFKKGL
jgi:TRAP-type mannitol/chloroaromatic compound transport system permease large subunit